MQKDLNIAGMIWSWHQSPFSVSNKTLKGLGHEMDIILKSSKFKTGTFFTCANDFLNFCFAFSKRKINGKFLLASLKTLSDSENCSKIRIRTLSSFSSWLFVAFASLLLVDFLQCTYLSRLWNNYQDYRRLPVSVLRVLSPLQVNEMIFKIVIS